MTQIMADASDAELIAAIRAGDQSAFAIIVRRYESVVARTAIAMLGPGDDADEAGQVAMIKLYNGLGSFRGDAQLKTFITKITMNTALDVIRKRKRTMARLWRSETDDLTDSTERLADSRELSRDVEQRDLLRAALAKLSPAFRSVVVLRLVHGYSPGEVAEILNISEGAVFSRLSRGRETMRRWLEAEMSDG